MVGSGIMSLFYKFSCIIYGSLAYHLFSFLLCELKSVFSANITQKMQNESNRNEF